MAEWSFRDMARGELNVDPIQSEFFSTEAIDGLTEALVRESIQNTLDANKSGETALVRFWFSGKGEALPAKSVYLKGLEEHLRAKGSGLTTVPTFQAGIPFLLIEDFGTRGLRGDPEQERDAESKNDFYYFWRNVGRSGKREGERGRWGLGKNVFPASSQINAFFGLTKRDEEPATLLLGQSVLKVHEVNGHRKYPYGYFANVAPDDQFALPISDEQSLNQFRADFHLARTNETGLSIVVLMPDEDIREETILRAVLRQYFYPIMTGLLSVLVTKAGNELFVDRDSLNATVGDMDASFRGELLPMLKMAEWAISVTNPISVKPYPSSSAPKWEHDALDESVLEQLRPEFEKGECLAFEVPITVKPSGKPEQASKFRVFLQRDLTMQSHRPMFVREGLIITDAVRVKQRGVLSLVVAEDKALADLLGDAENPAHTEWQSRSAHFKNRYKHGESTLNYVKRSVGAIVQMLTQSASEQDLTALADVFFLAQPPTPEERRKAKSKKPEPGPEPPNPDPVEPPQPRPLQITQVQGGFTVTASKSLAAARITAAYEVRRGDAFNRYHPADFVLGEDPIEIATHNTEVIEHTLNQLRVGPLEKGSALTVTGFDQARDLAVRISVEES